MATPATDFLSAAKQAFARRDLKEARRLVEQGLSLEGNQSELLHLAGCVALDEQRFVDARALLERARAGAPQSAAIACNLGNACFALNDFAAAVSAFREALDWAPRAADVAFKLGYALGRVRRWEAAAQALLLAARLGDARGEVIRGMGECARELVATGHPAPEYPSPTARAPGKISVIVCSISPDKLERLRQNLTERLAGEDWELIPIDDAVSLCEGYNRGVARSSGELLVLCHDDIRILSPDFAAKLRAYLVEYELIGVAGTTHASGPSWGWSGPPHMYCRVSQSCLTPKFKDTGPVTLLMGTHGPVVPGAHLLDGVFLAAHRGLVERIGFDEVTFDKFHFYDLDFSYRAYLAGARTAICLDIALFHESAGDYAQDYWHYADRFREKFPQACSVAEHGKYSVAWLPMAARRGGVAAGTRMDRSLDKWQQREPGERCARI